MFCDYRRFWQDCGQKEIAELKEFLTRFDIITTRPWPCPVADHYRNGHIAADWDVLVKLLPQHSKFKGAPSYLSFDLEAQYSCNMVIMRKNEFEAYMSFWWELVTNFARQVKPHPDPYQSRVYGFISERILTLYLYQRRLEHPTLRFAQLPAISCSAVKEGDISRPRAVA